MKVVFKTTFIFIVFFMIVAGVSYAQGRGNQSPVFPQTPTGEFGQNQGSSSSSKDIFDNLPMPSSTQVTQGGLGQAYGLNMQMLSSGLSVADLKNFYQNRLPSLGWQEVNTSGMFSSGQFNQMNMPSQTKQIAQNSLIFKKEDHILVMAFYNQLDKGQSTAYSITIKQMPQN